MSSAKRKMPPASLLQRRVRPRYEPEPDDIEDDMSDAPSEEGAGSFGSDDEDGEELSGDESGSGSDEAGLQHSQSKNSIF
jgi:ribosomal RNA-processing protein 36